jgi:hypothetical protein
MTTQQRKTWMNIHALRADCIAAVGKLILLMSLLILSYMYYSLFNFALRYTIRKPPRKLGRIGIEWNT